MVRYCLVAGGMFGFLLYVFLPRPVERSHGPIDSEIYVWHRQWHQSVATAIEEASSMVSGFTVLAAEVSWDGESPQIVRPTLDYNTLTARSTAGRTGASDWILFRFL